MHSPPIKSVANRLEGLAIPSLSIRDTVKNSQPIMSEPFDSASDSLRVSNSLEIGIFRTCGHEAEILIKTAGTAMYCASLALERTPDMTSIWLHL
jgi:hypothetical protein